MGEGKKLRKTEREQESIKHIMKNWRHRGRWIFRERKTEQNNGRGRTERDKCDQMKRESKRSATVKWWRRGHKERKLKKSKCKRNGSGNKWRKKHRKSNINQVAIRGEENALPSSLLWVLLHIEVCTVTVRISEILAFHLCVQVRICST
jgi:hypothetical protein